MAERATGGMADPKDFEKLALVHLDALYRAAWALSGRQQVVEDLVQATFLKAMERFDSFRTGTNCKAWLLQILRNTWIDQLRHRRVVGPTVPIAEELVGRRDEPEPTTWSDATDLLENFSDEQVIAALRELPDEQRLALYLTDVEQLSQEEAAEILQVPVGTVKSRASRARAALRDRLHDHARDLGLAGPR